MSVWVSFPQSSHLILIVTNQYYHPLKEVREHNQPNNGHLPNPRVVSHNSKRPMDLIFTPTLPKGLSHVSLKKCTMWWCKTHF